MMVIRICTLAMSVCLAGCDGASGGEVRAGQPAEAPPAAADSVAAPGEGADLTEVGLTVPSPDELQAALAGIDDPQLRQQVAPDGSYDAADCVVHIGQMDPVPVGQQEALDNASDAWRRGLARELGGETEANQMIGSSVNMLQPTPVPLRQAAVAWCVDNAPRG